MRSRSSSASGHDTRQRGASCGEVAFLTLVVLLLLALLWYFSESCGKRGTKVVEKPVAARYRCVTTPDGLIPVKAVIARPEGVDLLESPSSSSRTVKHAVVMASYVVVSQKDDFYQLGLDPRSDQGVGWVQAQDILLWTTKEGLLPNRNVPGRPPLLLWPEKRFIGNTNEQHYRERADSVADQPRPVLEADGGRYRIAMRWQSHDFRKRGVTEAWTDRVSEPDDVRFFYFTSKDDVRDLFEKVNQSLLELNSGGAADHPLIAFFKEHVGMTVGEQIDLKEGDLSTMRRMLRDLRNPISIAEKQPAEIRRDTERMKRDLQRLREFYQNPDHWNERGEGWLPREYLPGR